MIAKLAAWACLIGAYLVLAGQVSADEVVAGAVCAAGAVLWWVCVRRASAHTFAFEAGCWAAGGRAFRNLPAATLSVAALLLRRPVRGESGASLHWFFAHGRRVDAFAGGRRAIGVLAASLAPDSFVLRMPVGRDEIVIHALSAREQPADPLWPI